MSRKFLTKHFHVAKKYCAQQQLNGSQCLTHDFCAIFTGFTQHENCAIATVNLIKTFIPSFFSFLSSLCNRALFCHADMEDNGDK